MAQEEGQISDEQLVVITSALPDLSSVAVAIQDMIRGAYSLGWADGRAALVAQSKAVVEIEEGA